MQRVNMSKLKKILLATVIVIILLILGAMLILPRWIDPNHYKADIQQAVAKATGRQLAIRGNIEWQVFPVLGLKLPQVQLADTAEFQQPFMATVESTEVRINLLPLLTKRISIDRLSLNGLTLNLVKTKAGKTNLDWSQAPVDQQDATQPSPETTDKPTASNSGSGIDFSINSIAMTNTTVNWLDLETGSKFSLQNAHLSSKGVGFDAPFPVDFGFKMSNAQPELTGEFSLTALVTLHRGRGMTIADLDLDSTVQGPIMFRSGSNLSLRWKTMSIDEQASFTIDDLALRYEDLLLQGNLQQQGSGSNVRLNGHFGIAPFNLRKLLEDIDPALTSGLAKKAYQEVSLDLDLKGRPQQLSIPNLKFNLDRSQLTGEAFVGWRKDPQVDFKLKLNEIDLDRYLPQGGGVDPAVKPRDDGNAPMGGDNVPPTAKNSEKPAGFLQRLNLSGQVSIARLKAFHLAAGRIELPLRANQGSIQVGPMSALLYDGKYTANWTANVNHQPAPWQLRQKLDNISLGDLLKDATGNNQVQGVLAFSSELRGQGLDATSALPSLAGEARLTLHNGVYKGIDLAYQWSKARALMKKRTSDMTDSGQTEIADLSASWQINQGIAKSNDLVLVNPYLYAKGQGSINLPDQTMDYRLQTSEAERFTDANGNVAYRPDGTVVPLRLHGKIAEPSIGLDMEGVQKHLVDKAGEKLLDKVMDKFGSGDNSGDPTQDAAKEGAKKLFQGIFGR